MKKAVFKRHPEHHLCATDSQFPIVRFRVRGGMQFADASAANAPQGQHARSCRLPENTRNVNLRISSKVFSKALSVAAFL